MRVGWRIPLPGPFYLTRSPKRRAPRRTAALKPGLGISGWLVLAPFVVFYYMMWGLLWGLGQLAVRLLWSNHKTTM